MLVQLQKLSRPDLSKIGGHKEGFLRGFTDYKRDWRTKEESQSLFVVRDNLVGSWYHRNYLEYLQLAWANHFAVIISPDILWNGLLSEVAGIIAKEPERFRHLFTNKPDGKEQIIVMTNDTEVLPIHAIVDELRKRVPTDSDLFLPEFSTTDERSRWVRHIAFADAVSPFYDYEMMLCGIPAVDVLGSSWDYRKAAIQLGLIGDLLGVEKSFFRKAQDRLHAIAADTYNPSLWRNMFYLESCRSGHQEEVNGWIRDFYVDSPNPGYVQNFSSWSSKVDYKNISTEKNYQMHGGLFSSRTFSNNRDDLDVLVPEFGFVVLEKRGEVAVDEFKAMDPEVHVIDVNKKTGQPLGFIYAPYIPVLKAEGVQCLDEFLQKKTGIYFKGINKSLYIRGSILDQPKPGPSTSPSSTPTEYPSTEPPPKD